MMKKSVSGSHIYLINTDESLEYDFPYDSSDKSIRRPMSRKKIIDTSKYQRSTATILGKLIDY